MAPTLVPGASPLLGPAVALCGWTLVMEVWMYATRLPALTNAKDLQLKPEMTTQEINEYIPPQTRWKADK